MQNAIEGHMSSQYGECAQNKSKGHITIRSKVVFEIIVTHRLIWFVWSTFIMYSYSCVLAYCINYIPNGQSSSSLFSSDRLAQIVWHFHDSLCTKQQHFALSSAPAHPFFTASKSQRGTWKQSLNKYCFICDANFHHFYAWTQSTYQWSI